VYTAGPPAGKTASVPVAGRAGGAGVRSSGESESCSEEAVSGTLPVCRRPRPAAGPAGDWPTGGAVICTPPCIILAMMYSPHKTSSGASRAQRAGQGRDPGARGHRRQQLPRRQHPAEVRDGAPGRRGERGPERELLLAVVVDLRCPLA
jgi:hypothetical protein